ncbi:CRISPR-associated protein Csx19 [Nodularia sp. UHCC 0506]|uniref:type III-D CRISPR-associated protein Csx19 n=1 Tax=Nodularia sp. UHCC 0506 TaxID=3110243 RepID=UPI002B209644|nr:CRISPR-associated protein Csx19 [Nodularia sp. UHCC 0506]MEA5515829.1 CRISPR-associated protein Csx19 [Nodularia sp. UHCC 0506]
MNKPKCDHLKIPDSFDLKKWLEEQAKENQLNYLLAHADDGVIWGKFQDGELITTTKPVKLFPECDFPLLREKTLQQCRIFGDKSEVMIWKIEGGFKARLIQDKNLENDDYITENQILWGTHGKHHENGFTLLWDGSQGLKHAVPFTDIELGKKGELKNKVRLIVRHYIDFDDSGVARIYLSRLVDLTNKEI